MSDDALKLVRDKLRNVTLFIVDEISKQRNTNVHASPFIRKFSNRAIRRWLVW